MKRLILFIFLFAFSACIHGQKTASVYFQELPAPMEDPCNIDSTRMYYKQVGEVLGEVSRDINARKKEVDDCMKEHKQQAKETMAKNTGLNLTPEQMEKMKKDSKNMTQQQKMQMADAMMQQYANVSMEEVQAQKKNAKAKDTAAMKGWAMAVSTEKMADEKDDPAKIQAEQLKMKSSADLSQKQKDINAKLLAGGGKYTQLLDSLQKDADTAWSEMVRQMAPLYAKMDTILAQWGREENKTDAGQQSVDQQVKVYIDMINEIRNKYCLPLTPRYVDILNGLLYYLPGTFADCDAVDVIDAEIIFRQTGVKMPDSFKGLSALLAVQNYADLLGDVQKYSIGGRKKGNQPQAGVGE